MDVNKINEVKNIHYPKKELQLLYWQAKARDIKKKELKDIKKALYEIVNLGQYSPDFLQLINLLKCLPDKAIKSIENGEFTDFYIKLAKKEKNEYGPFYKGNFNKCNNLLLLLYTDYSNINSKQEFDLVANSFRQQIYIDANNELTNIIFNINPHLSYVLEDYKRYQEFSPKRSFNLFDTITVKLEKLYNELQTTLLMHIDIFNYQYNLPTDIILFLYENIETTNKTILKSYSKYKDKYHFCKVLLIEYHILKNSENNLNNKQIQEILNHKTRKLLK